MLDNLERDQILHNGKYGSTTTARPSTGLANTNPVAAPGSPLGWDVFASHHAGDSPKEILERLTERLADSVFAVQEAEDVDIWLRSAEGVVAIQVKRANEKTKPKPAGQVVLFKKIMEDWGFDEQEAATLLGLDAPSDVRDIYDGRKPVVHRDTNDRIRAILRIATDLDALYRDVRAIQDWLSEPQKDLKGKTPRSLLQEGSMENLLTVKYYVSHLSGR
jgi:hypothetical protein